MLMKARASRYPSAVPVSSPATGRPGPRPVPDLDATLPLGQKVQRPAPEALPMKCLRCQGPVERGTAPVRVERGGYRLSWEAVPAWVCTRCELPYFEQSEVEAIRQAVRAMRSLPFASNG